MADSIPSLPASAPAAIGDAVAMALQCIEQANAQIADPANQAQLAETARLAYLSNIVHLRNVCKSDPSPANLAALETAEGP